MSVSLLVDSLPYWNYTNIAISPLLERYLSEIFGDISGMLTCQFQMILIFLYDCQSVSWLTSLLILFKYRDNSSSGWDISLKFLGDNLRTFIHYIQIILIFFMSVSLLVGLVSYWNYVNTRIAPVLEQISFWRFLDTFLR